MYKYIITATVFCLITAISNGQFQQKPLRITDSVPSRQAAEQFRVLMKTELDSLVQLYAPVQAPVELTETNTKNRSDIPGYLLACMLMLSIIGSTVLYMINRQRKILNNVLEQVKAGKEPQSALNTKYRTSKKNQTIPSLEEKIGILNAELHKLSKENEGLSRVITEYNGIQHEYDSLRQGMQGAYKIKNYPGIDKAKNEHTAMRNVLDTEKAVAIYAYEKFLKPLLLLTDENKNNPAKMSIMDRDKILDLLLSLSFLYIEYLYLRVKDLAIGGHMVERIKAFAHGQSPDPVLLKQLSTESGSRALVMRMALNKAINGQLSYPVFEETNLNQPK